MPAPTSIPDKIRLIVEWLPVLQMLPQIAAATPGRERALEVVRLVELLASKTTGTADDQLVNLIKGVLLTEQGGQLVDYVTDKVRSLAHESH